MLFLKHQWRQSCLNCRSGIIAVVFSGGNKDCSQRAIKYNRLFCPPLFSSVNYWHHYLHINANFLLLNHANEIAVGHSPGMERWGPVWKLSLLYLSQIPEHLGWPDESRDYWVSPAQKRWFIVPTRSGGGPEVRGGRYVQPRRGLCRLEQARP